MKKSFFQWAFLIQFLTLFFLFLFFIFTQNFADSDLFGHLRYGMDALQKMEIPRVDIYSFTAPAADWIDHEWLTEILWALIFKSAGTSGLILAKLFLTFSTALFVFFAAFRSSQKIFLSCVLLMLVALALEPGLSFRPQLFSYFLMALLVFLVPYNRCLQNRFVLIIIPMMVLWSNLHGGFIAGLGYLALIGSGMAFEKTFDKSSRNSNSEIFFSLGVFFSSILVLSLLNPYGFRLWLCIYRALMNPYTASMIEDWQPWSFHANMANFAFLSLAALSLCALWKEKKSRFRFRIFFTISIPLFFAFRSVRNIPLFAIIASPCLASFLASKIKINFQSFSRHFCLFLCPILAFVIILYALKISSYFSWKTIRLRKNEFPADCVSFLKKNSEGRKNLAVSFHWGQYAIWRLWPHYLVSMDGRYDTIYPLKTIENVQFEIFEGRKEAEQLLRHYGADLVLTKKNGLLDQRLQTHSSDWRLWHRGKIAVVYKKK